ncbi:hypothetical protein J437_LFUL012632 [Ladona fulva]|uniref:Uncharacterized protein n=1 Tax=Ladona fulva TaxID=123851 RepID=A0A8K0P241_LADFU|nr:hypothetical protein J437_LFUL012632 [Ladona fulva]
MEISYRFSDTSCALLVSLPTEMSKLSTLASSNHDVCNGALVSFRSSVDFVQATLTTPLIIPRLLLFVELNSTYRERNGGARVRADA